MFTPIKLLFILILSTLFFYLLITYPPSFLIIFTPNISSFLYLANGLAMLASLTVVEAASSLLRVFKREAPIENIEKLSVNDKKQASYFSIENKSENNIGKTTHQSLTFFEKEKESHPPTLYGKELPTTAEANNSVFCPLGFQ